MTTGLTRAQFGQHLRRALADLHDPVALRKSPLLALVAPEAVRDRAAALRLQLIEAIDALQPREAHDHARAWRAYRVLHLRYVEARTAVEVERLMAVSTSQFYREHQAALEALTTLLLDRASFVDPASGTHADHAATDRHHNLPARTTSFVGRERELGEVDALLQTTRLLTLTGPGGCGKTRLALEAATKQLERHADGVWLADLTPLTEPGLVAQTVASALGVLESPTEPMSASLMRGIGSKRCLLILDNCEQVLESCAQLIDALLHACPNLHVLVTSRELVAIGGETVFRVPPLAIPDETHSRPSAAELRSFSALRLFVERAAAVVPGFSLTDANTHSVAQICNRLDGLPLAIELAAARVNVLSPRQIAERLDHRFRLLTAGSRTAPAHHHTLRGLFDWSYELLSASERLLFQRLAVFAGGWTVEAVELVCGGSGLESNGIVGLLASLVDRSLVVAEPRGDVMRYRMLETLREYAADRLAESEDAEAIHERHAEYYADLAQQLESLVYGPDQLQALQELEVEHNNFRAVLSNASRGASHAHMAASVAASLSLFWFLSNYFTEARHWLDWVLSFEGSGTEASATRCLGANGFLAASMGDYATGMTMCDRAVADAERGGHAEVLAAAYFSRCGTNFVMGDAAATERDARVGIRACSDAGWEWGAAICSAWSGRSMLMQRRIPEAIVENGETLQRSRAIGDPFSMALGLSFFAVAVGAQGEYDVAVARLAEALDLFRQSGSLAHTSRCLVDLAAMCLASGNIHGAAAAITEGLAITRQLGRVPYRFAQLLSATAEVAAARERWTDCATLLVCAQAMRTSSGTRLPPERAEVESALRETLERHVGYAELARLERGATGLDEAAAFALADAVLA